MKAIGLLILLPLLATCGPAADPVCEGIKDDVAALTALQIQIRDRLNGLEEVARETEERTREALPKGSAIPKAPPSAQEMGQITAALQRAVTAERDLAELKAQVKQATHDWYDSHVTYETTIQELGRLLPAEERATPTEYNGAY